jgi:hypothetical protein
MTHSCRFLCIAAMVLTLASAATLFAQAGGPRIKMVGQQLDLIFKMGPKGTEPPVTAHADSSGVVVIPQSILAPTRLHTQMVVYRCPQSDGSVMTYVLEAGAPNPCQGAKRLGAFWWDDRGTVMIDAGENGGVTLENDPAGTAASPSLHASTFTPSIQLRGFGGASFVNGNTPATAGFDGVVLFPLGNRVLVGPTAGFQWVDSSIVHTIGGGPPPSTFIHTGAGFKSGNFGGEIDFPLFPGAYHENVRADYRLDLHVDFGATVASSTITQQSGFCGTSSTTPTGGISAGGCTTSSTATTHDTVVGPFVGGYISLSILSHVGVFVGYDYKIVKDTKSSNTLFDLNYGNVVAGFNFTFGGR